MIILLIAVFELIKVNLNSLANLIIQQPASGPWSSILYELSAINRQKYNKPPKCLTIRFPQTANA
jgi:hypothetical protein